MTSTRAFASAAHDLELGPGHWTLDRSHHPGGTTPICQALMTQAMPAGIGKVFEELGVPARTIELGFVGGFAYTTVRALVSRPLSSLGAPASLPPDILIRLFTRFHPEFRRRIRAAASTLSSPRAPAIVDRWKAEIRPAQLAANARFQADAPVDLSEISLAQRLKELTGHARSSLELHFWLHGHDLGPIGRFLHTVRGWGISPDEASSALAWASPSTRRPRTELAALRTHIAQAGTTPRTLDDIRSVSHAAATALDAYLGRYGHMLVTGYDLDSLTLNELPQLVLASIVSAHEGPAPDRSGVVEPVRRRVLPSDLDLFDSRIDEAAMVMDMRDDNTPLTVHAPFGLLRQSLLEFGSRRMADAGWQRRELALELTLDEVHRIAAEPSIRIPGEELLDRALTRKQQVTLEPATHLGFPEPVPPLRLLPAPLAELSEILEVTMTEMGLGPESPSLLFPEPLLTGTGVGSSAYTGVARVAESPEDAIPKLQPGEVLILRAASPTLNTILPIVGAIVTSHGGALSQAAVLARELQIPAIIGVANAFSVPDGAKVTVDPVKGQMTVIER